MTPNWLSPGWAPDNSRWFAALGTPPDLGSQWFAPGWALETGPTSVFRGIFGDSLTSVFQCPSGRKPMFLPAGG
ncbi:MAG: hypothetical protein HY774_19500 [Acidobacteria bacterium]|nr:hypothetical protein [Acidobacteriota bacterium]